MRFDLEKISNEIKKINEERDWDKFHTPENIAKSISIEANELLECFQWTKEANINEIKEELADVLSYCIMMSQKLNIDLEEIMLDKLEKNKLKYPVEKAKGKCTKYNKL